MLILFDINIEILTVAAVALKACVPDISFDFFIMLVRVSTLVSIYSVIKVKIIKYIRNNLRILLTIIFQFNKYYYSSLWESFVFEWNVI